MELSSYAALNGVMKAASGMFLSEDSESKNMPSSRLPQLLQQLTPGMCWFEV